MADDTVLDLLSPDVLSGQLEAVRAGLELVDGKVAVEERQRAEWMAESDKRLSALSYHRARLQTLESSLAAYLASLGGGRPVSNEERQAWTADSPHPGPAPQRMAHMRGPAAAYWVLRDAAGATMPVANVAAELVERGWVESKSEETVTDAVRVSLRRARDRWPSIVSPSRGAWMWDADQELIALD
ncbi:MAG: hypothetical protein JWM89_258 [Acidimicrobiales bacterium]|nr:hypothetical protein [Acidimicrobiales bacterium]